MIFKGFSPIEQERIALRNQLIQCNAKAPRYLLEPEIKQFLSYIENDKRLLFKTLWMTGGRISEVLMLTPHHFSNHINGCMLAMPNLKQKIEVRTRIFINQGIKLISISDKNYLTELNRYIVTNKINKQDLLFAYSRNQVNYLLSKTQQLILEKGVEFPFKITPHTFRHSCAMHLYYNQVDEKVIQQYLGHSSLRNTQVYTQLFHSKQSVSHVVF